ncbi:MAG: ATP-dependent helicase [Clostridiaceae bacterium]|jgi:CRISPR-associated endonuclease/helicase Cas3|nr:ATP-dependent helicase [Clostridiaceae bacterium]
MQDFLKTLFKTNKVELTEVQEKLSKVPLDKNLLVLSSTGSGKTEGSYYIANKWGGRHIYVLPQKTLATTICDRLDGYNEILNKKPYKLNHSSIQEDTTLQNDYTVTTIDQVLSGYLGLGVQSFRKGKNVVKSNMIFDEIQLFDPAITLNTTLLMLDALKNRKNRFIIMTATMPEYLINFLKNRYDMEVIITDRPSVANRKVKITYEKELDFKKINDYDKKQIIICNTIKELFEVYLQIKDKSRCIVLNSKLLLDDRFKAEKKTIKYFGKGSKENNKILISTQVIEAGMDISTSRMYSSISSIDSLIQRDGRVVRWGGEGEIICYLGAYQGVYDKDVVMETIKKIVFNQGINFSWDIQKKWINEILNPYYEKYVTDREINKHKNKLRNGNKKELIRDIKNVNIVVDYNPAVSSFNRQTVSVSLTDLEKLSKTNTLYRYKLNNIEEVQCDKVDIGSTIIIKGYDCYYDNTGFRLEPGSKCIEFPISNIVKSKRVFKDYKEEAWILHSFNVKQIMYEKLIADNFSDYTVNNALEISNIAGLHDLGKLDVLWQGKFWANAKTFLLAHFPYRKGNPRMFENRKHSVISAQVLKPYVDLIQFNMLLQHHGRIMTGNSDLHLKEYELDKRCKDYLTMYGFNKLIKTSDRNRDINCKDDILTPIKSDEWVDFLYLTGTLMDCDIEAIERVQKIL